MRFALISDIHGNVLALDAVLDAIEHAHRQQRVDAIFNLGDIFYGPLWPRRTWERLRGLGAITIRGNQDRDLLEATPARLAANATLRRDLAELAGEPLTWLRSLPTQARVGTLYACHGIPGDDLTYLLEDVSGGQARPRDEADVVELLDDERAPLIVCGHTHTPRSVRLADGRLIVNPGSVGLPAYDDRLPNPHRMQTLTPQARWALVDNAGGAWRAELHATDYDHESAARRAFEQDRADWGGWLRTGRAAIPA